MPKLEYFIVAESVSVDQDTNRISLFNVLEIVEDPVPTQIAQFTAVAAWLSQKEEGGRDFRALLKVDVPGAEKEETFTVNFTVSSARNRTLIQVEGLNIPQHGEITFSLFLNGDYVASHSISVVEPNLADSGPNQSGSGARNQTAASE